LWASLAAKRQLLNPAATAFDQSRGSISNVETVMRQFGPDFKQVELRAR
jgi:hypothetical protein